ncbi:Barwin-like endoglucanase [Mycena sanguinolenta]|uniref:Barwin-like endoglucanase n=1 Tax=Mycena sanguinolenta TaxID=230812 RepID=A0A8H6ZDJ2_9AGAR|nr:Barwin-like endoglucanase [Mycena sanguinolenta]
MRGFGSALWLAGMVAASTLRTTETVGQASLFIPPLNGAPQQCGSSVTDSDLAVMISPDVFDGGAECGKNVTVSFQGRSVVLQVAGECVCITSSIEMTMAAFTTLNAPFERPVTVNWEFD